MKIFEYIVPGVRQNLAYAERLLKGIPAQLSARKPVVNGTLIECNHPVFVFGHLAIYPSQLAQMAGISSDGLEVPERYGSLFQMGSPCQDDPDGTIYPSLVEVSERFFSGMRAVLERLPEVSQQGMDAPLEHPGRRERFGTVGAFTAYVLLAHPQSHLGQVSVWRRCMGLGPA